jgi:hypothetical protein
MRIVHSGGNMKRLALVGAVGAALVAAGIAVAHGNDNQTVTKVATSFNATTASGKTDTKTCTTADGKSLSTTRSTWTGTATTGPADLIGAVRIDANSMINTTDNVGEVDGHLTISPAGGGKTDLHFTGVYDGGTLSGLATGHSATHGVQIYANLSSLFSTTGGFSGGKIGGTSGGSAVELGPAHCAPAKPVHENSHAEGTITALPGTSITVAGLTCAVPTGSLASKVATFHVGDQVHIECALVSGTSTLTKIEGKH